MRAFLDDLGSALAGAAVLAAVWCVYHALNPDPVATKQVCAPTPVQLVELQ